MLEHLEYLERCVELAEQALEAGDQPFGSILVAADGTVLAQDRNRIAGGDQTQHPEFALARWAADNLSPADRATATVYTSGEHCPMCSAAHAWVGLGPIVYAASTEQFTAWLTDLGVPPAPVLPLAIPQVAPGIPVTGPFPEFSGRVHDLHRRYFERLAG